MSNLEDPVFEELLGDPMADELAYVRQAAQFDPRNRQLVKVVTRDEFEPVDDRAEADLVSSEVGFGLHKPVLDIDFPAQLVPSSTPGHFHLYLDKEMIWPVYRKLLEALADAGVIQEGCARHAIRRGASHARLPEKPKHLEGPDHPLYNLSSTDEVEAPNE